MSKSGFSFTNYNKNHVTEFIKHSELFKLYGEETVYEVIDAYTMTPEQNHSEYGDSAIFIIELEEDDGTKKEVGVNLPQHMVATVRELNKDSQAREAIKEGLLGFKLYEYTKQTVIAGKVKDKTYVGVELLDI